MQSEQQAGSLQGKFQGFGAAPSDALWGNIAGALDEKKKRKGFYWWWIGSAMAAVVVLTITLLTLSENETPATHSTDVVSLKSEHESENSNAENSNENLPILNDDAAIEGTESNLSNPNESMNAAELNPDDKKNDKKNSTKSGSTTFDFSNTTKIEYTGIEDLILSQVESSALDGGVPFGQENVFTIFEEEGKFIDELESRTIVPITQKPKYPSQRLCQIRIDEVPNRQWEFGFEIAYWDDANFNFKKELAALPSNADGYTNDLITEDYMQLEAASFSSVPVFGKASRNLNINLFAGKYFAKRWAWRSGVNFSRSTYTSNYPSSFIIQNAHTALTTIAVPLALRFDMMQKPRYKMRAGFGVINEVPFLERVKGSDTNGEYKSYYATAGYFGALQLDFANEWKLKSGVSLNITPSYRWYFTQNVNSQNGLVRRDHWLGIAAGLSWEF